MGRINKIVNIARGLNNAINPTSPLYDEGSAYVSDNSRLNIDGTWAKSPSKGTNNGTVPTSDNKVKGPNGIVYEVTSAVLSGGGVGTALVPIFTSVSVSNLKGTRQKSGIYYYMCTAWDNINKRESLPSSAKEHWVNKRYDENDTRVADVPKLVGSAGVGTTVRWYRSRCIPIEKGDTQQLTEIAPPTEFYYLGEGTTFYDYAGDAEIAREDNLYNGRGSAPPSAPEAIGRFDGRMFYFKGNVAYWSSAGRPEEVPQNYTLTVVPTYSLGLWNVDNELVAGGGASITLTQKPRLDGGLYSEAKMTIPELSGKTVKRAQSIGGKLWVWTASSTGYIVGTGGYEGYKYIHISDDCGLVTAWCLIKSPYGVFGADSKGIWQLGEIPKRISRGVIDIATSGKSTYVSSAASSFGCWCSDLNEYWWKATGNLIIVYQADLGVFAGPYKDAGATAITNKVELIDDIYQCYFTSSTAAGVQTLKFWLGQSSLSQVKDALDVEIIYNGNDGTVTAKTYQNSIASETGAKASGDNSHTTNVGIIHPPHSGRFFEVNLSIPTGTTAPVAAINYSANALTRLERGLR